MDRIPRCNVPRIMFEPDIRTLRRKIIREPEPIYQELLVKHGLADIHISIKILAKYIKNPGFEIYIVARKLGLGVEYKVKRLEWIKDNIHWLFEQ
jgi:hypothetical protein